MPVAPWEPAANVPWDQALGSWYAATRGLLAEEHVQRVTQQHTSLVRRSELLLQSQFAPQDSLEAVVRSEDLWSDVGIDALVRRWTNLHIVRRDRASASYLAGLAAGGRPNDWVGWFCQRIDAWDDPAIAKSNRLQLDWLKRNWEQLPLYWTY